MVALHSKSVSIVTSLCEEDGDAEGGEGGAEGGEYVDVLSRRRAASDRSLSVVDRSVAVVATELLHQQRAAGSPACWLQLSFGYLRCSAAQTRSLTRALSDPPSRRSGGETWVPEELPWLQLLLGCLHFLGQAAAVPRRFGVHVALHRPPLSDSPSGGASSRGLLPVLPKELPVKLHLVVCVQTGEMVFKAENEGERRRSGAGVAW